MNINLSSSLSQVSQLTIPTIDYNKHNWDILESLLIHNDVGVALNTEVSVFNRDWRIEEKIDNEVVFLMMRDQVKHYRETMIDQYGLLGLSQIDLKDTHCILTEGVSDYFSARLVFPSFNVLGLTTLSGSFKAKCIYMNLFDSFTLFSDNDFKKDNVGIKSGFMLRKNLTDLGKKVQLVIPETPHNDLTDNFIFRLKVISI